MVTLKGYLKYPGIIDELVCEFTPDWSKEIAFIRSVAMKGNIDEAVSLANVILKSTANIDKVSMKELNDIISSDMADEIMSKNVSRETKRKVLEYSLGI